MYHHAAVQDNLRILRERGVFVVEPQEGELACGWEGKGRLADPDIILEALRTVLSPQDLLCEHVLVTAGPTREHLDPVRFLSNRSSGKMGFAVARVALRRGAQVTLVTGPTHLSPPRGAKYIEVKTAQEMYSAVMENLNDATVVVKTAAVSDYRPGQLKGEKIKKHENGVFLQLVATQDILSEVSAQKGERLIIGFAAETKDLLSNAKEKLVRKNLDWIVANDISKSGVGFEAENNQVSIIHRDGTVEELPEMTKEAVAYAVLDRVVRQRQQSKEGVFA
jgi:phosphopantothenoylcysteine decarboxylase/phosphopantothenate--cysteine ligase